MMNRKFSARTALFALLLLSLVMNAFPQTSGTTRDGASQQTSAQTASAGPRDEKLWRKALEIQRKSIVVDTHNDITSMMLDDNYDIGTSSVGKYHTDLARMKQGGLTAEFFSVYVDKKYATEGGSARRALDMIDMVYRAVERYPNDFMFATSAADIRKAKREGKIAALMGIEGGHAIEDSLMALRDFYRLGIRYTTLTHNNSNNWADSSRDKAIHNGLTDFGKDIVREMNRLGMLVDVSHVSDKTMSDVLDVSKAPIIASHSSARALSNHPRNIPDDLLRRIAQNGGVIMINFYPAFVSQKALDAENARDARLKPQMDALKERFKDDPKRLEEEQKKLDEANPYDPLPLSALIDQIDYTVKVAGIDHVGLGSDFDGMSGATPQGIDSAADLPKITQALLDRGYSADDIRKILGGNLLRVLREAERISREMQSTASTH